MSMLKLYMLCLAEAMHSTRM